MDWLFGAVIGIVVALILILILYFTAFKGKKITWLYVILFILFGVAGGLIQYKFFKLSDKGLITPQEQIENVTSTIEDNWKNTNGGFIFEQIQIAQEDEECPSYDDQIIELKCYDFGGYIVFSFEDNGIYQNILFCKSDNGLILDGVINSSAKFEKTPGILWWEKFKLDSFKWYRELEKEPYYYEYKHWFNIDYDNLASMSRQSAYFIKNFTNFSNAKEARNYALQEVSYLAGKTVTDYFIRFGDVELIGTGKTGYVKINSFYNYLYEQIKGQSYDTSKIIDATNSLCVSIPTEIQKNYPISADKKAEYGDAEYYGVYNCNIAVDLSFKNGNKFVDTTINNEEYYNTIKNDDKVKDKITIEPVQPNYQFSKIALGFKDSQNSDLAKVDLAVNPVKIKFTCNELNLSKTVTISSFDKLNVGLEVLLNNNQTWNYLIESESLIFDNFRGSFVLNSEKTSLNFDYYYLDNFTIVSVGLNPIGTIDKTSIDLVSKPVRIILSNDNNTYQFVFDNNSVLDSYKNMLVEMGTYSYTILSEQLIFASVTGNLTITTTDKVMLFNYSLKVDQPLNFDVKMSEKSSNIGQIHLISDTSNVTLIRDSLPNNKTYIVSCYIYDEDGKLIETFSHNHASTGSCTDFWIPNNLVTGTTYTAQLRFSASDDSTITYLSDISTFTYSSSKGFELRYTATKNN